MEIMKSQPPRVGSPRAITVAKHIGATSSLTVTRRPFKPKKLEFCGHCKTKVATIPRSDPKWCSKSCSDLHKLLARILKGKTPGASVPRKIPPKRHRQK
jgi:hypothetical protein